MSSEEVLQSIEAAGYSEALLAFIMSYIGIIAVVALVVYVLLIVAMWKIFTKAGEKGWKSIIPIYNSIILFKISGVSPWLILAIAVLYCIPVIGVVAGSIILIYQIYMFAKSFGKGVGYTILLILPVTSNIAYLVLGLGDAKYVGPGGKEKEAN